MVGGNRSSARRAIAEPMPIRRRIGAMRSPRKGGSGSISRSITPLRYRAAQNPPPARTKRLRAGAVHGSGLKPTNSSLSAPSSSTIRAECVIGAHRRPAAVARRPHHRASSSAARLRKPRRSGRSVSTPRAVLTAGANAPQAADGGCSLADARSPNASIGSRHRRRSQGRARGPARRLWGVSDSQRGRLKPTHLHFGPAPSRNPQQRRCSCLPLKVRAGRRLEQKS